MRKFKSKGSFSRKCGVEVDDFELDLTKIKQYSSLQTLGKLDESKSEDNSQIELKGIYWFI